MSGWQDINEERFKDVVGEKVVDIIHEKFDAFVTLMSLLDINYSLEEYIQNYDELQLDGKENRVCIEVDFNDQDNSIANLIIVTDKNGNLINSLFRFCSDSYSKKLLQIFNLEEYKKKINDYLKEEYTKEEYTLEKVTILFDKAIELISLSTEKEGE